MTERASRWDAPTEASASSSGAGAAPATSGALIHQPISASDAATAAAAIAAKISASLQPQGLELVQRAPEEGDYIKDIEVNDLRNRYVLTRSATQKQVSEDVTVISRYPSQWKYWRMLYGWAWGVFGHISVLRTPREWQFV